MLGNDRLNVRAAAVAQFDALLGKDFVVAVVLREVFAYNAKKDFLPLSAH